MIWYHAGANVMPFTSPPQGSHSANAQSASDQGAASIQRPPQGRQSDQDVANIPHGRHAVEETFFISQVTVTLTV